MPDLVWAKQMGRITYLLSSVAIAVLCGAAVLLLRSHPESRHVLLAAQCCLAVLAVIWIRSLESRLQDAGLPRWSFWPYFLLVFTLCFGAHAKGMGGPRTLALFLLLQISALLLQSQPASGESLLRGAGHEAARKYPEFLRPVGRFLFLLRVVLLAAFGAALLHLVQRTSAGVARWEMCLALAVLGFVWIYNVEGRALDAQLPSWVPATYCMAAPGLCFLPFLFHRVSLPTALALFIVLQIPTVFLQSRTVLAEPPSPSSKWLRPGEPIGSLDFAVYTLLIAGLWHVLHLLRGDAGGGHWARVIEVALDAGSLSLCLAWVVSVKGRLKDLRLTRWYIDSCFIVFILCLLPFAFRILTFSHALILFVVLQIPAIFIRREFIPASFSPGDSNS
ncbi:MAG: hypothetical protein ABSC48_16570 [Terracidiphilus sp.]